MTTVTPQRLSRRSIRFAVVLLILAAALVFMDHVTVSAASDGPLPNRPQVHASKQRRAKVARGVGWHRRSRSCSNYYEYVIHWWLLPLVAAASIGLSRMLWQFQFSAARILRGLLPALVFLLGINSIVVEARSDPMYQADPELFWTMRPNRVQENGARFTNDEGFRPTPTGALHAPSVLLLGDSSTFGYGVEARQTYAWQLSDKLAHLLGQRPAVFNCGVPGYTSWQGRILLARELAHRHPDVVVEAFMANDYARVDHSDENNQPSGLPPALRALLLKSNLYLYLSHILIGQFENPKHPSESRPTVPRVSAAEFEDNLEQMYQMCEQHGSRFVLLALPMKLNMKSITEPYRELCERVASRLGVSYLNLFDLWAANGMSEVHFPIDSIHPDAEGHALIATTLAGILAPLLSGRQTR